MKLPSSFRVLVRWLKRRLPATLFARSLLIIVLPVALMQVAVTYVFFDAHWQTVTARLSEGLAGDIAWAVESYREDPTTDSFARLSQRAEESMSLSTTVEQYRTKYVFLAPSDYDVSWVDVVQPKGTTVTLDGQPINPMSKKGIGTSSYEIARVLLGAGNGGAHVLTSSAPVGIQVIGYGQFTSYQYPGGLNLGIIAPPPPPPQ